MAYDEKLAQRIRAVLGPRDDVEERPMFGGLTFMVRSHMACGVLRDDLMLRVGTDAEQAALARPHARPMDFTGRPLPGMIYVAPPGCRTPASLKSWVDLALAFVATLPAKKPAKQKLAKKTVAKPATAKKAAKKATATPKPRAR